jgi:hypothetical protein
LYKHEEHIPQYQDGAEQRHYNSDKVD